MTPAKGRKRRREGFYADGAPAREEGADEQAQEWAEEIIAVMRARVAELARGRPEDVGLLMKSVQALLRTAAIEQRLSRKQEGELGQRMQRVLDQLGAYLVPPPE